MFELSEVFMFCGIYSFFVMGAISWTIYQQGQVRQLKVRSK